MYKFNPFTKKLDYFESGGGGTSDFLSLADTPNSYSGQARRIVKVDDASTGLDFATELTVNSTDNTKALFEISQTKVPTTDRCGATHFVTTKSSGATSLSANWFQYSITDTTSPGGFEISTTAITIMTSNSGGAIPTGLWVLCVGPTTASTPFMGIGAEINYQERIADRGLYTNRPAAAWFSAILNIVPESFPTWAGDGYNVSAGIVFAASVHTPYPAMHVPIFIQELSIASGGIGMLMQGGTSSSNDPRTAAEFTGHFNKGLDFSAATLNSANKEALTLANLQTVVLGTARLRGNGNDLEYYDVTAGAYKTFSNLGGVNAFDGGAFTDTYVATVNFDGGVF